MYWKLNRIQYPIYNLGPGTRIGIWVQGCSLPCNGCISESLWTCQGGKNIDIEYLVNQVIKTQSLFDGITITGGEPFDQYEPLIVFCANIKKKTDLTIYLFSGYPLEELEKMYPDHLFMQYIDYLLDGRYIKSRHDDQNAGGYCNQNLYRFSNGKPILQKKVFISNNWSVTVPENIKVFISGIPRKIDIKKLVARIEKITF